MKVLIADDCKISQMLVEDVLIEADCEVLLASNGEQALRLFRENEEICMVILDWQMPKGSGLEVCREIRALPRRPHPFIAILSGRDDLESRAQAEEAGADGYMSKPLAPDALLALVDQVRQARQPQ